MSVAISPPTVSAPESAPKIRMRVIYRDASGAIHFDWPIQRVNEALADREGNVWVDVFDPEGKGDGEIETLFRDTFHFHVLSIEDALQETHVPRIDDWGDYLYIVFHSIDFDAQSEHLRLHEIDIFLGVNYLVTYHIEELDFLEQDRRNIERDPTNRMRHGADHLLYHLLDAAVAEYLPAIEHLDEAIDDAQEQVFSRPTPDTLRSIFRIKRTALRIHRVIGPEREVLNRLARDSYEPIADEHRIYFRDVYDHLVRIHDLTESLRDLITGALDTYLSAISNRTNDIMKVLTIINVMFLPMSFVAGFFGMNFFASSLDLETAHWAKWLLFVGTCVFMAGSAGIQWYWARKSGWF